MKYFSLIKVFFFIFIILLSSCEKKNEENPRFSGDYVVSYDHVASYSQESVRNKILFSSILYPELDTLIPSIDYAVEVYRINYKSSFLGESIIASGLICIPLFDNTFPFLSFQNGTNTCNSNTPSFNPDDQFYSLISVMAGAGYVIIIPDYIGFGASEDILHLYHHKASNNDAVLDMLRAASEFVNSDFIDASVSTDLFLMGYSQGGWASMSVLEEIEKVKNSEFTVKAAACGAGAYNLTAISEHIIGLDSYESPHYLPYFIESRRKSNIISNPLTDFFKEPYANTIPDLFGGLYCNDEVIASLTTDIDALLTDDLLLGFQNDNKFSVLRTELELNSIQPWDIMSDVRFFCSVDDKSVPFEQTQYFYSELSNMSSTESEYSLIEISSKSHNEAIIPWGIDALVWINSKALN
jgi:hypothetical protein